MISNLVEVYCLASNLTKKIDQHLKKSNAGRKGILNRADYLTIAIIQQKCSIKTNKSLYKIIKYSMRNEFPNLPSYQQFCEGLEGNFMYLAIMGQVLGQMNKSVKNGEYIVDSTTLPVCKTIYSKHSKLGNGLADYGKNLEGWFLGFKLHLIITTNMDIVAFKFSPASTSDIAALDNKMVAGLHGYLIGDKGYISSNKTKMFLENDLCLITRPRKNMKKLPVSKSILSLLSKRQRVETVFGQLKDNFMLISNKVRSVQSFFAKACAAIVAQILKTKPNLLALDHNVFNDFIIS